MTVSSRAFALDVVPDFSEESVPVINQELKKLDSKIQEVKDNNFGYALIAYGSVFDPADSTTYLTGSFYSTAPGTGTGPRLYIPRTGTITKVFIRYSVVGTLATTELSSLYIYKNASTDYLLTSNILLDSNGFYEKVETSIPVTEGEFFNVKWVTPAWATNPTTVRYPIMIWIEYPST